MLNWLIHLSEDETIFEFAPKLAFSSVNSFFLVPPFPLSAFFSRGPRPTERSSQPPQQSWMQDPDRPSIVSASELKELDNLDTDADEGWAGKLVLFKPKLSYVIKIIL